MFYKYLLILWTLSLKQGQWRTKQDVLSLFSQQSKQVRIFAKMSKYFFNFGLQKVQVG